MIRRTLFLFSITLAAAFVAAPAEARYFPSACQVTGITNIGPEGAISGKAKLCVQRSGLKAKGYFKGLEPGHAYTVWWVYIDQPQSCEGGFEACVVDFFLDANPKAVFGLMDSGIAPRNGRLFFGDRLKDFQPSEDSALWFLAFGHGPADLSDGRRLARQLLTPEDPNAGAPFLGVVGEPTGFPAAEAIFSIP